MQLQRQLHSQVESTTKTGRTATSRITCCNNGQDYMSTSLSSKLASSMALLDYSMSQKAGPQLHIQKKLQKPGPINNDDIIFT